MGFIPTPAPSTEPRAEVTEQGLSHRMALARLRGWSPLPRFLSPWLWGQSGDLAF